MDVITAAPERITWLKKKVKNLQSNKSNPVAVEQYQTMAQRIQDLLQAFTAMDNAARDTSYSVAFRDDARARADKRRAQLEQAIKAENANELP